MLLHKFIGYCGFKLKFNYIVHPCVYNFYTMTAHWDGASATAVCSTSAHEAKVIEVPAVWQLFAVTSPIWHHRLWRHRCWPVPTWRPRNVVQMKTSNRSWDPLHFLLMNLSAMLTTRHLLTRWFFDLSITRDCPPCGRIWDLADHHMARAPTTFCLRGIETIKWLYRFPSRNLLDWKCLNMIK